MAGQVSYPVIFNNTRIDLIPGVSVNSVNPYSQPTRKLNIFSAARQNRKTLTSAYYSDRALDIGVYILAIDRAAADKVLDTLIGVLQGQEGTLILPQSGTVRQYTATLSNTKFNNVSGGFFDFTLTFMCSDNFGYDTNYSVIDSRSGLTASIIGTQWTQKGTADSQVPFIQAQYSSIGYGNNLITNPGFEVNLNGWVDPGYGGTRTRVTTQHNSGVASAQIVATSSPTSGRYGGIQTQITGVVVGQIYNVQFFMKGNVGGEAVVFYDGNLTNTFYTLTNGWVQYTATVIAGATTLNFVISTTTPSATFFLDDVTAYTLTGTATVTVTNPATGQSCAINRTWSTNDLLQIDTKAKTVQVNGVDVVFTGAIPEWTPGTQNITISDTFGTRIFSWFAYVYNRYV